MNNEPSNNKLASFDSLKPKFHVQIRRRKETAEIDFLTHVDESLVPPFHTGELLMMKRQDHIHVGELGIFLIDGSLRLKLMGAEALYSLNPKYPPIYFSFSTMPKCVAKYLGVLSPEWINDEII